MAEQGIDALQPGDGSRHLGDGACGKGERPRRYSAMCIAQDVAGLVEGAGGWLFDRAMAGWDVSAFVDERSDPRALHILGVRTVRYAEAWAAMETTTPTSFVVAGERYASDVEARRLLQDALGEGADVTVFGSPCALDQVEGISSVTYRLTAAAHAFKMHALAVAGRGRPPAHAIESLRQRDTTRPRVHIPRRRVPPKVLVPLPSTTATGTRMIGSAR